MDEVDRYTRRIEELKAEQFELAGLTAPLAPDAPERAWFATRARAVARELIALHDHGDELRRLDRDIERAADAINAAGSQRDNQVASRRSTGATIAALGALLLVISGAWLPTLWLPATGFALVAAGVLARRRASALLCDPDPTVVAHGDIMERLEVQRDAILAGQSPSASNPANAPEWSVTPDHASSRDIPGVLS